MRGAHRKRHHPYRGIAPVAVAEVSYDAYHYKYKDSFENILLIVQQWGVPRDMPTDVVLSFYYWRY